MKELFDPLVLITKGNTEIKEAYYAGVKHGREKELEIFNAKKEDYSLWFDKRIKEIQKRVLPKRNTKSNTKPKEKKWYINGYKDAKKMFEKSFNPLTK